MSLVEAGVGVGAVVAFPFAIRTAYRYVRQEPLDVLVDGSPLYAALVFSALTLIFSMPEAAAAFLAVVGGLGVGGTAGVVQEARDRRRSGNE